KWSDCAGQRRDAPPAGKEQSAAAGRLPAAGVRFRARIGRAGRVTGENMATKRLFRASSVALPTAAAILAAVALTAQGPAASSGFRAGTAVVDLSPQEFPVRVNGMFTERSADRVVDPLYARALALDDGKTRLAICVVDSCMLPRDLIDRAKDEASAMTGLPP